MPMSKLPDEKNFRGPYGCPYRALWTAVIVQALRDVQRDKNGKDGHSIEGVVSWVGTADFYTTCRLAGASPTKMEARFRRAIAKRKERDDGTFDRHLSAVSA